ncbi:hypothetical protein BB65665_08187 [Bacillus sp. 916]|nr:hypothetical protein BB65665_08187 [Bacillus sp. 916]
MLVIESAAAKSAKICRKGLSKRQRYWKKPFSCLCLIHMTT